MGKKRGRKEIDVEKKKASKQLLRTVGGGGGTLGYPNPQEGRANGVVLLSIGKRADEKNSPARNIIMCREYRKEGIKGGSNHGEVKRD